MKSILKIFIVFGILFLANTSFAVTQISPSDIDVNIVPSNPAPFENVTVTINSYATDLNGASIEWSDSGKVVLSGVGKISYSFQTGAVNTSKNLSVKISPSDVAGTITKQILIKTSEIDLLWESPSAYTPPFYKGKALPTSESTLKVVAMPNTVGVATARKNMIYAWKSNFNAISGASGYGKDSYTFKNDSLNAGEHISVAVSSTNSSFSAQDSVDIPIIKPLLLFYKKSPTEGVLYQNVLTNDSFMTEDEMTVVAEPYFLSTGNTNDFQYAWKINGNDISTPKNPFELTVRPSSRGGYATISLSLESISKLFQTVAGSIRINL